MKDDKKRTFRSAGWFARTDKDGFIHRSWMRGYPQDVFDGRPVIGICNTWSELTPCNAHFRQLADHVKRGVWEMGGFPVEFPVMSSGETNLRPTAMLFRNLISMDVEESIRANPIDGVVLLCGCDKTTPALIMGAASVDLPTIVLSGGAMLNGKFCGQDIGSGTDVWRFSEEMRAGRMSLESFMDAQTGMSRSTGVCNVMGTASTMAVMVESLGMSLPHNAAIPAPDSRRLTLAQLTGRRIVEMVHQGRENLADPQARGVRECDSRQRRRRRFDQCRSPSAGDGRPRGCGGHARRLGPLSARTCRRCLNLKPSGKF